MIDERGTAGTEVSGAAGGEGEVGYGDAMRDLPATVAALDLRERFQLCFGCGPSNPTGLKLRFRRLPEGAVQAEFTPGRNHQGWPGVMHGGLVSALIDEAFGYATWFAGLSTATGRMEIRFRRPVPLGKRLHVEARLGRRRRKLIEVEGSIQEVDGPVLAEASATMFVLDRDELAAFLSLEQAGGPAMAGGEEVQERT